MEPNDSDSNSRYGTPTNSRSPDRTKRIEKVAGKEQQKLADEEIRNYEKKEKVIKGEKTKDESKPKVEDKKEKEIQTSEEIAKAMSELNAMYQNPELMVNAMYNAAGIDEEMRKRNDPLEIYAKLKERSDLDLNYDYEEPMLIGKEINLGELTFDKKCGQGAHAEVRACNVFGNFVLKSYTSMNPKYTKDKYHLLRRYLDREIYQHCVGSVALDLQKNLHPEECPRISVLSIYPHIVKFTEKGDPKVKYGILMAHGGKELDVSLRDHQDKFFSTEENANGKTMMHELRQAILYFRQAQFTHFDIKPDNLMITEKGNVNFIDTGGSRHISFDTDIQNHTFAGTPAYTHPICNPFLRYYGHDHNYNVNQWSSKEFKELKHCFHYADMYALSITCFEMCVENKVGFNKNKAGYINRIHEACFYKDKEKHAICADPVGYEALGEMSMMGYYDQQNPMQKLLEFLDPFTGNNFPFCMIPIIFIIYFFYYFITKMLLHKQTHSE